MRVSLPLMFLISIGLHLSLVGGYFIAHTHFPHFSLSHAVEASSTSLVMVPEETLHLAKPPSLTLSSVPAASISHEVTSLPASTPVIAKPDGAVAVSRSMPATPSGVEINPNRHIKAPQAETALAPTPAPVLNSQDGIVFLLDISGSMYESYNGATRLAFAREDLTQRLRALKDGTPFAIVVYGQTVRASGPLVAASDITREAAVRYILQDYDCGGGTNLPDGFASAQDLHPGGILLLTDGDLNIAPHELLSSTHRILGEAKKGPALSIIAIAPRTETKAIAILKGLAEQQGGTYAAEQADDSNLVTAAAPTSDSASR